MTREEHRAYHREYQRRYRVEHHDKVLAVGRAYRQRQAAARGPITATCAVCGKTFVKVGHYQKFCSIGCRRVRRNEEERAATAKRRVQAAPVSASVRPVRAGVQKVCKTCGKTFEAATVRAEFCSKVCNRAWFNRGRKRPTWTKTCPSCGKTFETSRVDKVYCSKECWKKAKYKPVQLCDLVCVFCGKAFTSKVATAKHCSSTCAVRHRSGYASLADFEKVQAARKASFNKQHERDRNGLTLAQVQEVIDAQDGDPSLLWKRSQTWTKAQHKYAKRRYQDIHGLYAATYNP